MAAENIVRMTAQLYEMRDTARRFLGDEYAERMAALRKPIEAVQARLKCSPLGAAADICNNADIGAGGFEVIFLMAAAVEMLEPSAVSERAGI